MDSMDKMDKSMTVRGNGLPEKYNHNENVAAIKRDIEYIRGKSAEYAIRIGNRLIMAQDNIDHGKWLEMLEEVGIEVRSAQRMMRVAQMFGDKPEMLEGMTQQKALLMASLPEEQFIQLKDDEVFMAADGTAYTLGEIREMTGKQLEAALINLRNQKNAEVREWREKAQEATAEMKATQQSAREQAELMREIQEKNEDALTKRIFSLEKRLNDLSKENNELLMEMKKNEQETVESEEAMSILFDVRKELIGLFGKMNQIDLVKDVEVQAELLGVFDLMITYVKKTKLRLANIKERLSEESGNIADQVHPDILD
jgi:hypothetical protein